MNGALPLGSYRSRNAPVAIEKISVSVNSEDLAWAKKRAKRLRKSLSSIVSEALQRERQLEAGWQLLDELGTDDITEADLEGIRKELGWPPIARSRVLPGAPKPRARRTRARKP